MWGCGRSGADMGDVEVRIGGGAEWKRKWVDRSGRRKVRKHVWVGGNKG